jgi:hypothetical protein
MDKSEKRRINPLAKVATCAVVVLLILEGLVIGGAFELKSQTVAKYAPWAYESFLRLVGEHPESSSRWVEVEEPAEESSKKTEEGLINASGLEPSIIPVLMATNAVLEPSVPMEVIPEPIPVTVPTNAPQNAIEEVIPVG